MTPCARPLESGSVCRNAHRSAALRRHRATHGGLRLDRHWRNLRTHTLHDPVAYKLREIGEWALKQQFPVPSFYS